MPLVFLIVNTLLLFIIVFGVAMWLHQRCSAPKRDWFWGAVTFVLSQVVRGPFVTAAGFALAGNLGAADPNVAIIGLALALLTSGLFEEGARYVMLHYVAKTTRGSARAMMFGAGHGGIEALLLFSVGIISAVVLLYQVAPNLDQLKITSPDQAAVWEAQIALVQKIDFWQAFLSFYERIWAIVLHIALSIMVMRAVQGNGMKWLWFAMLCHIGVNTLAVLTLRSFGPVAAEVSITMSVIGIIALLNIQKLRYH